MLNLVMIGVILALMARAVKMERLLFDFWGARAQLGSVLTQLKSTMLVTLWTFIGVEGAVVLCAGLYVSMSVLPFGLMTQPELAGLAAPSGASVLRNVLDTGGQMLVMASLLVTLLNSWLAWTILVSELPYEAAQGGVFPKFLARTNRFGAPA